MIKDGVGNAVAKAFGNPKKAFLIVHKPPPPGGGSSPAVSVDTLAARALSLSNEGAADGAAIASMYGDVDDAHVLQVQYNPSSVEFSANAEPMDAKRLQANVVSDIPPQFTRPPSVMLSVDLVFDAMNVKDSFMSEKLSLKPSDVVAAPAAILNREKYTVQPQTNALIAMLMSVNSRQATFYWSGLAFYGIVTEAEARYTMFSVSGRPVRSIVTIRMRQDLEKNDGAYWNKAFDKCFGGADMEGNLGDFGGQSTGQYTGNLLNLSF
jgi:hypothetical protein